MRVLSLYYILDKDFKVINIIHGSDIAVVTIGSGVTSFGDIESGTEQGCA